MADWKECFERGLLRTVKPSAEKGRMSIRRAGLVLNEAEINLKSKAYDSCVHSSYLAMFHAARAILFRDGVREKSHYCVARYLERYVETGDLEVKWVNLLDRIRDIRHSGQYDLDYSSDADEAASSLRTAADFVKAMQNLFSRTKAQGLGDRLH